MQIDVTAITQEVNREILGEKEALVRRLIYEELKKFQFDENNVTENLISFFMTKQNIIVPLPEKKDIPSELDDNASEMNGFVNADVAAIYTDLMVGNNVYLFGKAGTGKTTLAKKVANLLLQREAITLNCNQFTSPINIIGGQTIEGYKQGKLVEAWERGAVLILDELPKLDPNTAGLLNEALAESAGVEQKMKITKQEYDSLKEQESKGADLGIELYKEGDDYIKKTFVTITDGKGDKIKKHKNFCVIATGNTNMKEVSTNFSGNNRQDYSLVDRFAGSFYEIKYDTVLEKSLIYERVYKVATIIREVLDEGGDSVESVSLRTMLNFNRIFEQEQLRRIGSKYAVEPIKIGGRMIAKTFRESIDSFINTLPDGKKQAIAKTEAEDLAGADVDLDLFIEEFKKFHKVSP